MRGEKLEREAKKRRETANAKKVAEERLEAQQRQRGAELDVQRLGRRKEQQLAVGEAECIAADERLLTGGINFSLEGLQPYRLPKAEDDKVFLPETSLVKLSALDAFSRGAVLLRLWSSTVPSDEHLSSSPKYTTTEMQEDEVNGESSYHHYSHCGICEFSAPPGTVGLPDKIILSLLARSKAWEGRISTELAESDEALASLGTLSLKLVTLPKVTHARLQPVKSAFFVVGPVKQCLEENLRRHTALTVGDCVTVWYRGKSYELRVSSMKPIGCGSLLDTDVVVDLDVSMEQKQADATTLHTEVERYAQAQSVYSTGMASVFVSGDERSFSSQVVSQLGFAPAADDGKSEESEKELMRERRLAALGARGL